MTAAKTCGPCPFDPRSCDYCPTTARFDGVESVTLRAAAPGPIVASPSARTIEGIVVPYGPAGATSGGRVTFAAGSLRISDPKRVKLLIEHDQGRSIGYGVEFAERPEGLWGRFHVPEGAEGDQALAQAANGVRDAFSVGVQLDASVAANLRRAAANGAAVKGTGDLRETSLVSVPAFDAARVESVAASGDSTLVVSAWADPTERNTAMKCDKCGTVHPAGVVECSTTTASTTTTGGAAAPETLAASPTAAASGTLSTSGGASDSSADERPQVVRANYGEVATVTAEPSTYSLDGQGASLVRDAWAARMDSDSDAAARVRRFNSELVDGNAPSVQAFLTAAVETGATTDPQASVVPTLHRPDLMRRMIDRARPIIARLDTIPINSATPFSIPEVGDFVGVGDHVEGTAHVAEGDLALDGALVRPKASSGAYRISRELVDSSNPALDRIALRKMVKDYRRHTEGKAAAAIETIAVTVGSVTTVMSLRSALLGFVNDDDEGADFVAASPDLLTTLAEDVDGTGRPHLPTVGPMNAVGTWKPGGTGTTVENAELVRAGRVAAGTGAIVRAEGVYWFESPVQQFTFSEVEGPGIVKLALWGYSAAAIPDAADVLRVQTGALV